GDDRPAARHRPAPRGRPGRPREAPLPLPPARGNRGHGRRRPRRAATGRTRPRRRARPAGHAARRGRDRRRRDDYVISVPMTSDELREAYLGFFEARDHRRRASGSLIPAEYDPSVLLTTAGMHPLKNYFLGVEPAPHHRLTSSTG